MRTKELLHFIKERYSIFQKKEAGKPKPWTKNPTLLEYRFCNVHRENDAVTKWIRENWREPNATDPQLWFAMAVARLVNWPDSLAAISYPVPFKGARFIKVLHDRRAAGVQMMSGAYVVSTNGNKGDKVEYLERCVLSPLWQQRKEITPRQGDTLAMFSDRLQTCMGFAGFMAGQVVADAKFHGTLHKATDWWTYAVSGPGSRKGLNIVMEREVKAPWKEREWLAALHALQAKVDPQVAKWGIPRVSAQDLQNVLCETSKMVRGYSRSRYPGAA